MPAAVRLEGGFGCSWHANVNLASERSSFVPLSILGLSHVLYCNLMQWRGSFQSILASL
jgi:hypothetical protein